jgi:hypothetical protein
LALSQRIIRHCDQLVILVTNNVEHGCFNSKGLTHWSSGAGGQSCIDASIFRDRIASSELM